MKSRFTLTCVLHVKPGSFPTRLGFVWKWSPSRSDSTYCACQFAVQLCWLELIRFFFGVLLYFCRFCLIWTCFRKWRRGFFFVSCGTESAGRNIELHPPSWALLWYGSVGEKNAWVSFGVDLCSVIGPRGWLPAGRGSGVEDRRFIISFHWLFWFLWWKFLIIMIYFSVSFQVNFQFICWVATISFVTNNK